MRHLEVCENISTRGENCSREATYGKEEVGNVVSDVYGDAHVDKVEAVAQPDQADGDDVMSDKLTPIFAWLLQHQHQNNELLRPVASLQQVVSLDQRLVRTMGKVLIHAGGVEVPDGRARHDPESKGAIECKVQGGIRLLHEARLLCAATDAIVERNRLDEPLHAELARKAQHDDVESNKSEVACALAIVEWCGRVGADMGGDEGITAIEGV